MKFAELISFPNIKTLYLARFISNFGNGMAPIALAFGVLALPNGSAQLLGLVLGVQTTIFLIMTPFGGVIADRYGRARMVGICDLVGGLMLFVQVAYFATGNVPTIVLLLVNGLFGILWGIWWPAFAGIMPAILPETALQRGNAVNSFVSNIGAALALGIDAATFVYSGIAIYGLRNLTPALQVVENKVLKDLKDGWKVFISFRWIVVIVSCFSFIVMCWAAAENVLGPLIALKHFDGAKSWSLVISAESAGLIIGSFIAFKIKLKYPMRFLMLSSFTLTFYIWSLAKPQSLLVIAFFAFLFGITLDLWGSLWTTALQTKVPREALSRVTSFDAMGSLLFRPIGLAIAAPLSNLFGLSKFLTLAAALTAIAIIIGLLDPQVRNMQMKE